MKLENLGIPKVSDLRYAEDWYRYAEIRFPRLLAEAIELSKSSPYPLRKVYNDVYHKALLAMYDGDQEAASHFEKQGAQNE